MFVEGMLTFLNIPGSSSVGWEGSIFNELVIGVMSLAGVLECQFEHIGETVSLFSSINTGGTCWHRQVYIKNRR